MIESMDNFLQTPGCSVFPCGKARFRFASGSLHLLAVLLIAVGISSSAGAQTSREANWRAERIELNRALQEKLQELVLWCRSNGVDQQEKATWSIYRRCGLDRHYLFLPTEKTMPAAEVGGKPGEWFRQLTRIRRDHATSLFALAERAARADEGAVAFRLLHEVLYFDRDHARTRKMLGHVKVSDKKTGEGRWKLFPEKITVKPARKPQSDFGWPAKGYYIATTPHFYVYSNATEEQTKVLAHKLEIWHYIWRQLFFEFWKKPSTVKAWFDGKGQLRIPTSASRRFKVAFFRNHQEYVTQLLKQGVRGVEKSSGYYHGQQEISCFPAVDANGQRDESTWRHELAHQLFRESIRTRATPFAERFLWLDEGVAMYFESVEIFDSYATVGGFDAKRLQFARMRKFSEGFHVPIAELSDMDMKTFQSRSDIALIYAQSAGIAHMLMDGKRNTRSRLVDFLKAAHKQKINAKVFQKTLGLTFEELEEDYDKFLQVKNWDVENRIEKPGNREVLAIPDSELDDGAFDVLAGCQKLQWLDLSGNTLYVHNAKKLNKLDSLGQLFLSRCRIQAGALETLDQLASLREIDLSSSSISDKELLELTKLPSLEILRISNTRITDAAAATLTKISGLKTLIVSPGALSKQAIEQFKRVRGDVTVHQR